MNKETNVSTIKSRKLFKIPFRNDFYYKQSAPSNPLRDGGPQIAVPKALGNKSPYAVYIAQIDRKMHSFNYSHLEMIRDEKIECHKKK